MPAPPTLLDVLWPAKRPRIKGARLVTFGTAPMKTPLKPLSEETRQKMRDYYQRNKHRWRTKYWKSR